MLRLEAGEQDIRDDAEQTVQLEAVCQSFAVWDSDNPAQQRMYHKRPSYIPIFEDLQKRAESLGETMDGPHDDSDAEFAELQQEMRKKKAKVSDASADEQSEEDESSEAEGETLR